MNFIKFWSLGEALDKGFYGISLDLEEALQIFILFGFTNAKFNLGYSKTLLIRNEATNYFCCILKTQFLFNILQYTNKMGFELLIL